MTHFLAPIIFVITAIGLFFGYIDPGYNQIEALRAEEERYDEALDKSRELQRVRDQLLAKYNSLSSEDLERLQKLLPDNVDNVRLILDLDSIASKYDMRVRNVAISRGIGQTSGTIGPNTGSHNSFLLTFAVTATYENFLLFIQDLETSLRLVDVADVSFEASDTPELDFKISIRTYWLE